jgi:hypothetical protein
MSTAPAFVGVNVMVTVSHVFAAAVMSLLTLVETPVI